MKCSRCGFNENPVALDFHHREVGTKDQILSAVALRGWGEERILAEIAKCDVLCANCHRIKHDKPS